MPVSELRRGMKGYGLTVFEGTKPERFDVEVIDVLHNFLPRQELILIKTSHPRLEVAKVVAGMSGSPIYINNKMIGAYAYGWTFGKEPVAGVTPIRSMLDDLVRPLPEAINGWPIKVLPSGTRSSSKRAEALRSVEGGIRFAGPAHRYDLGEHARQVAAARSAATANAPLSPVASPLLLGGMGPGAMTLARDLLSPLGLEPLQAGGGGKTEPDAPKRFEDGGAVGVQMIRGDMSAMALGTVTRVEGDSLVAFGHPMMQAGVTALPTAVGRVLWFLASEMRSFKMGMPVRPVGALVNDRQSSVVISHTAQAPVIPVTMKIRGVPGAPYEDWSFEVSHERFMTPTFMAIALGNALQTTASERQDVSFTAKSRLKVKGRGELVLEDFGVTAGGTPEPRDFLGSNLVQAAGALLNNPWESTLIERVDMEIELRFAREIQRLRGAEVLESEIDAGSPARVRLTLLPYAGPPQTKIVSVPIPAHLAGQTVTIQIAPGYSEEREVSEPESLDQFIRNLENPTYPPKSLVFSFSAGGAVAYRGHVARQLPIGALDAMRPTSSSVAPSIIASPVRHVVSLPDYVVGRDRVTVTVKPVLR
jgi:hypothetical protein